MLEPDRTYSIKEIGDLKDFVTVAYVIIDDIYQKVTPTYIKNRCNINDSILSDSEIITISIVGELLTIDSENAWFSFCKKNMKDLFPKFCDRSRFNRTRRNLHAVIEEIRKELSSLTELAEQPYRVSEKGIELLPVQKNNSKVQFPKAIRQLIFKLRRRIETTASQLTQQLNIEQVLAKSFWGLQVRIKTKLLAYNLCYYINKLIGRDINISRIKHLVFG